MHHRHRAAVLSATALVALACASTSRSVRLKPSSRSPSSRARPTQNRRRPRQIPYRNPGNASGCANASRLPSRPPQASTGIDHVIPLDDTGPTGRISTDNLAFNNRLRHRVKTHRAGAADSSTLVRSGPARTAPPEEWSVVTGGLEPRPYCRRPARQVHALGRIRPHKRSRRHQPCERARGVELTISDAGAQSSSRHPPLD
jgi:hypothetical protein